MQDADLHTVLRCPRGTFSPYTEGTQTNVIFFTKGRPTTRVWIYDARANVPKITKVSRPLTDEHFAAFETCFGADPNGQSPRNESDSSDDRWRAFGIEEVKARGYKIDSFKWLRDLELDDPHGVAEPDELLAAAFAELESVLEEIRLMQQLASDEAAE